MAGPSAALHNSKIPGKKLAFLSQRATDSDCMHLATKVPEQHTPGKQQIKMN